MKTALRLLILPLLGIGLSSTALASPATQQRYPAHAIHVAQAAVATPSPARARLWNLQDADILSIINEVSLETGKNFVVDPRVSGKISLVSSKPIQTKEVYAVFLSILELLGYSAIPSGNIVKIVPNMESSEHAARLATTHTPGKGDEVVIRVIPLQNVSAAQLIPVIRPLLPQWSNLSVYAPGNVLIIVGHAGSLQRILDIIENVDQASNNTIDIVPLHHASASQMATVLANLENTSHVPGDASLLSIAADERSNSILLSGNKSARAHLRIIISQLDSPLKEGTGNTAVVYLRYLQAKTFAPLLNKIAHDFQNPENNKSSTLAADSSNAKELKNSYSNTTIQAEPNTNSLIITAPTSIINTLNAIIAKLDIRPAQVLVEGIIVEIDQDDLKNLGIQWGGLVSSTTNMNIPGFPAPGAGVVGIIPGQQFQAILSFLQTKTGANILSTPSVVVLDNHKAILEVGKEVPFQTGSYATTGSATTATPFNTTSYKNVTLKLEVTPQINLGNAVRLAISLQNDTLQNPDSPGSTPLTNISRIQNSVIVDSSDILVLGGLISNNITHSLDKVPLLGDLPIVGKLLQHTTRKLEKKNLVVFIKPVIMHDSSDALTITNTKYDVVRQAQIHWPINLTELGVQKTENVLPLWKNPTVLPKPFSDD